MNYAAISIQGNILSSEILEKIRTEDIRFQKPIDFNLHPGTSVRDEINLAWSLAISNWSAFKLKRDALLDTDSGTSETRRYWMLPLLSILGYEVGSSTAEIINAKSYAISHRANNKDGFPIHVAGVNQSLDKRPETGGTRLSPHALVQEYVNNTEHLYGIVSNGRFLRLLRDATRLSRLSYLEFDLEQMMEEGLYVEFALLYRTLHASRMPETLDNGAESVIEFYHQESIASGSRIRERLSTAVENSIRELANGLLHHPQNEELCQLALTNKIGPKEYYLHTLRLVYRMLFLLVIEERKLIYAEKRDEELNKKRNIYYEYYSIQRLTKLAVKMVYVDPRKTDLWHSLLTTFALFEKGDYGKKLGIEPLGSGLFSPDALGVISRQMLDNECLLKVIRYLVTFVNENGQLVRVNYADLDVEEFGSVYEGLLEYDPVFTDNAGQPIFSFIKGDARSSSGSHYTPEALVKPLIVHSLDYLIADRLKEKDPESALLSLSICDVACGSGHILLSAARRVGFELARYRSNEDQPTPTVLRAAIRDVIKNCIYGVDLNPLAVELCKVALWLEAHQPGEPLNFLDHHIKCGNAIVGLAHRSELEKGIATEAFKELPGDDKPIAKLFRDSNAIQRKSKDQVSIDNYAAINEEVKAVIEKYNLFKKLPETNPEEVNKKAKEHTKYEQDYHRIRLKQLADAQVAQFFIPKTIANKDLLLADAEYRNFLRQVNKHLGVLQSNKLVKAQLVGIGKHFFHWFLEFPEVFENGGFDCVLGNPPYLGGSKISGFYGNDFLNFLKTNYYPAEGLTDLISYFFRRIFDLIRPNSFFSVITTNSVYQGDSRESSLDIIYKQNGRINFAIRSIKWPGQAKIVVSLISIFKGEKKVDCFLDGKKEEYISQYLDTSIAAKPKQLIQNQGQCFIGSSFLGTGFVIKKEEFKRLKQYDPKGLVMFPTYNGDDLNNEVELTDKEYVIYFNEMKLSSAEKFPELLEILRTRVLPERQKSKQTQYVDQFWKFKRPTIELYKNIERVNEYYITSLTTRYLNFTPISGKNIYSHAIGVVIPRHRFHFAVIQSTFHSEWAIKEGSSLANTIRYTPSDCFETFPFPQTNVQDQELENIGDAYMEHRRKFMLGVQLGLTRSYNLFHCDAITTQNINAENKEVASLQKHLAKMANAFSFDEAIQGILKHRELHVQMDTAVLDAYGWNDIDLKHDFYDVDYLPENDRKRYTIHPDARKEVLKRLLELNHKIHEEEEKSGLWEKKGGKKKSYSKKDTDDVSGVDEPDVNYGGIFNQK
jgi:hypothetical protein